MPRVKFLPSGFETDIQVGTSLVDLTDEYPEAEVPYSCRSASCGTCRVQVKEGKEALSAMDDDEQEVIEIFGDDRGDVRLCCQIRLEKDCEKLVLEVCDP